MAKRSPRFEDRVLSAPEMRTAILRFERRIEELEQFDPQTIRERSDPRITDLEAAIDEALTDTFGAGAPSYDRYRSAAHLDRAGINMNYGTPLREVIGGLERGKGESLALMRRIIKSFGEKLAEGGHAGGGGPASPEVGSRTASVRPTTTDIFIIHGRDDAAKTEVAHLIMRAGLNPVILHEMPNAGRTIIEKFEHHGGAAGFAVALLTPDDVGGLDEHHLQPRARQNVIGELFWFAGNFGRDHVVPLKKGDVELPSDILGVAYTPMDASGTWKNKLLQELEHAGYTINWPRALS